MKFKEVSINQGGVRDSGMSELGASNYSELLVEIKQRIRSAQYEALKAVNKELIALYWDIGRMIVTRQQGETWGKSVVETLSKDLQAEFPGISGFSAANVWRMKLFYETYVNKETRTISARNWLDS